MGYIKINKNNIKDFVMKKKNLKRILGVGTALFLFTGLRSFAGITLASWSSNTYVYSDHPSIFYYLGTVSVRGSDRKLLGSIWHYPAYSKITYDFQGEPYVKSVSSQGESDTSVRTNTIRVDDSLSFGEKTQVYGKIGSSMSNVNPYSLDKEDK